MTRFVLVTNPILTPLLYAAPAPRLRWLGARRKYVSVLDFIADRFSIKVSRDDPPQPLHLGVHAHPRTHVHTYAHTRFPIKVSQDTRARRKTRTHTHSHTLGRAGMKPLLLSLSTSCLHPPRRTESGPKCKWYMRSFKKQTSEVVSISAFV